MSDRQPEELRQLLRQRTASAVDAATKSGGQVSAEELETLERLARLVELQGSADPSRPRRPWGLAALLAVTLLVVSLLLFARVRETAIELEVNATEVSFSLPSQQVIFENLALAGLGVSGLRRIELPDPLVARGGDEGSGDAEAIQLTVLEESARRGSINIEALVPLAETGVWLRRADLPKQYRISLRDPQIALKVDVFGPLVVSLAGIGQRQIDFTSPHAFLMEPAPGVVDLDLRFGDLQRAGMTPQVPVRNLAFFRVDEFADRGVSIVRRLSTILSGTLHFESLNGVTRQLRAGEDLRFTSATGEVRTLRLDDDHLTLNFHGRVRGMRTGSDESPHDLMPTWLDWLRARHGLSLLWGSTLYLFGMALAVVRWFKGPV